MTLGPCPDTRHEVPAIEVLPLSLMPTTLLVLLLLLSPTGELLPGAAGGILGPRDPSPALRFVGRRSRIIVVSPTALSVQKGWREQAQLLSPTVTRV